MDSVTCTKCREPKPLDGFYADRKKRNGLSSWCKKCVIRKTVSDLERRKSGRGTGSTAARGACGSGSG